MPTRSRCSGTTSEASRRDTRIYFIQPLKESIICEVGYWLSLEGAS